MAKKILIQKVKYKTGTEMSNIQELIDLLSRTTVAYAKDQAVYRDGTQSITVELHFTPATAENRVKKGLVTHV